MKKSFIALIAVMVLLTACDDHKPTQGSHGAAVAESDAQATPAAVALAGSPAARQTSDDGLALIRLFEGWSSTCYLDAAGMWTSGFGHMHASKADCPKVPLSIAEGVALQKKDVGSAERGVQKYVRILLNQNQFDALVSFVSNVGLGRPDTAKARGKDGFAFLRSGQPSTLLKRANAGLHSQAAEEIKKWTRAAGKVLLGLVTRRYAEAKLYLS